MNINMNPTAQTAAPIGDDWSTTAPTAVEILPDFVEPTEGVYILSIPQCRFKPSENTGQIGLTWVFQVIEPISKLNPQDLDTPPGALFSLYHGPKAVAFAAKLMKAILGDQFEQMQNLGQAAMAIEANFTQAYNIQAKVTIRQSTNKDTGETYRNIELSSIQPVQAKPLPEGVKAYTPKDAKQ